MSIIKLEYNLLVQLSHIIMSFLIRSNSTLYSSRYEEILLLKTQLLTCVMVIVRIKYLNNVLCKVFFLNSLLVITLIEKA